MRRRAWYMVLTCPIIVVPAIAGDLSPTPNITPNAENEVVETLDVQVTQPAIDLRQRAQLFGDMGGLRPWLAEHGHDPGDHVGRRGIVQPGR